MNECEKSTRSMGQTIRRLRIEQNLTQETLAELLGVTSQAISKWENNVGLPDIAQIVPLAGVFGVTTDVLFGLDSTTEETEVQLSRGLRPYLCRTAAVPRQSYAAYRKHCARGNFVST